MQSVKLNLIPGAVLPVVNVSQYDVKRTFALAVYDGAASYDLTGKTVTIRGTKPDNHGFDYGTSDGVVSVSGNTVTISTTQQMTAVGGQVMAELRIESGTTIIGTLNFIIDVEPSALSDDTIISDTEIPVIERDFEAALAEAEADALVAEGYAKGTQDGVPVGSGSPYYHDNAKHYKDEAEEAASGVLEKYPKIVGDYWYIWDVDTSQYVNTGVRAKGTQGDPGEGVPAGGTTGQVLRKKSDDKYDTEWANGGGGASALDDLTDVTITTPASGDGLLYDGAEWVNADVVVPDELTDELRDAEVIEGKNRAIQNGTRRTPASVTYTEEANGVIDANGTATGSNSFYYISEHLEWKNEEMVLSGCPSGGDANTYRLIIASFEDSGASVYVSDTGSGAIVPANTGGSTLTLDIYIRVAQNASVSHKKFSPMLCTKEDWDKSHEYKPYYEPLKDGKLDVFSNSGYHNSIYRGKYLGDSVTADQWAAISAGTFDDLFIGDYWTINSVNYRIAAFDYWLHTGDTECTTHHVVLVPDTNMYTAKMNDTDITTGGYTGSKMYTNNLASAKTTIDTAFGSAHILSHKEMLVNAVASGHASGWAWFASTVELMSESMVYGHNAWAANTSASGLGYNTGIDKGQLPLFALEPSRICNRAYWWLRDVVSSVLFANVEGSGYANCRGASNSIGVRPVFGICG